MGGPETQAARGRAAMPKAGAKPHKAPVVRDGLPPQELARESWLLELVAWQRHAHLPGRVDLHGHRSTKPPIWLDCKGELIILDFLQSVTDLKSRPRAFSQQAGRYEDAVQGARLHGKRLRIELLANPGVSDEVQLLEALAKYLEAEVSVLHPQDVRLALAHTQWPDKLQDRNPLAWAMAKGQGA